MQEMEASLVFLSKMMYSRGLMQECKKAMWRETWKNNLTVQSTGSFLKGRPFSKFESLNLLIFWSTLAPAYNSS